MAKWGGKILVREGEKEKEGEEEKGGEGRRGEEIGERKMKGRARREDGFELLHDRMRL